MMATCAALMLAGLSPLAALSSHQLPRLKHQIDARSGVPAFKFGYEAGFNPAAGGQVTIYGDGIVSVTDRRGRVARTRTLSRQKLNGLLRIAETRRFFSLPDRILSDEPAPDSTFAFISIHTVTVDKTVNKQVGVQNKSFDDLFAALYARAGLVRPAALPHHP
jgi:hypothetical protein